MMRHQQFFPVWIIDSRHTVLTGWVSGGSLGRILQEGIIDGQRPQMFVDEVHNIDPNEPLGIRDVWIKVA